VSTIPRLFCPLTISGSINLVVSSNPVVVTPTPGTYYDPEALAADVQSVLDTELAGVDPGMTSAVTVRADGRFSIEVYNGVDLDFLGSGTSTSLMEVLGLPAAVTQVREPLVGTSVLTGYWTPEEAARFDSFDQPVDVEGFARTLGGQHRGVVHGELVDRSLTFELIDGRRTIAALEVVPRFRYWPDRLTLGTWGDYYLANPREAWRPERMRPSPAIFAFTLSLGRYVA
jgi:hypothetical protein